MTVTVPAHEALCDEEKCNLENPCIFCRINDLLTDALDTDSDIDIDDGA